jgi:uncharacterized protein
MMRKVLFCILTAIAAIAAFIVINHSVFAFYSPGSPNNINLVYDYAYMMSDSARTQLDTKLVQFANETSNQIAVVTIDSLKGDTIENFAVKLFEEWGIGKKDKDNGVLLLIAREDRQMRIEVGYGLEGALTDAQSYWIIQNEIIPAFQSDNYDQGITNAVDKIIAATKGEYVPSEKQTSGSNLNFKSIKTIFFLVFFGFIWLGSILARSKSWWAGGIIGAIIGILLIIFWNRIFGLIATALLTPLGFIFDYFVSKTYKDRKDKGMRPPWWIGGPGFGGRGGGFGGGGFGGFGGGHSGGGGASGRW